MMVVAAIAYTCQLYMEFSGTMDVVIGSAELFGIVLPENFKRPFFQRVFRNSGHAGTLHWVHGSEIIFSTRFLCQSL